jgi:hypothetical protein
MVWSGWVSPIRVGAMGEQTRLLGDQVIRVEEEGGAGRMKGKAET